MSDEKQEVQRTSKLRDRIFWNVNEYKGADPKFAETVDVRGCLVISYSAISKDQRAAGISVESSIRAQLMALLFEGIEIPKDIIKEVAKPTQEKDHGKEKGKEKEKL